MGILTLRRDQVRQLIDRLPWHIYGLYAVCGASLLMGVVSLVDAWDRPVSAVSGIPQRSDTIDVLTGIVRRAPVASFGVDLQPGDRILSYGGVSWEQTQRLNLHELSGSRAGETIPLLIQRGSAALPRQLTMRLPDAWERLVLIRLGLGALVCWIPPTLILIRLTRQLLRQQPGVGKRAVDPSGVGLWFLTWQAASIGLSVGSLKYPVAVLWTDMLSRVIPLLVALISLPYPLAPRAQRSRWLEAVLALLSLIAAISIIGNGLRSPFVSDDWRRSVQLLRPVDPADTLALACIAVGGGLAIAGIVLTASAPALSRLLRAAGRQAPSLQRHAEQLAAWLDARYAPCPPSIAIIARFQLLIIGLYSTLDLLPRALGGAGSGYSTLFAAIPLSYLLLYSDIHAQRQGHYLMTTMLGAVLLIQFPTIIARLATQTYGSGVGTADILSIAVVASASLLGGALIGLSQWRRQRQHRDPLQAKIDTLFTRQTQDAFWQHLTLQVGPELGVRTWLWAARDVSGQLHALEQTPQAQRAWLDDPALEAALGAQRLPDPLSVIVDTTALPTTLILLPIYWDQAMTEVLIAANPTSVGEGARLLSDRLIHSRLMNAVNVLRGVERERSLAAGQQALAEQRQRLLEGYRELQRQQRRATRRTNLQLSALLHDNALQELARVVQSLRQLQRRNQIEDPGQVLAPPVAACLAIDGEVRRVLRELRPRGAGQPLADAIEDMVNQWERAHPTIRFVYNPQPLTGALSDLQRDSLLLLVSQAVENALEHATPTAIQIGLAQDRDARQLTITVRDDGRGFRYEPAQLDPTSLGLLLMHDLAEELGGQLEFRTAPGAGCQVQVAIDTHHQHE